jgi:hypothetical protein
MGQTGAGLLDGLADRLLTASPYEFTVASDPADRATAYRIRATAAVEAGWARPDDFPGGLDEDGFDAVAVHVLGWDGGLPMCTGRLVFPPARLPTEVACGAVVPPRGRVVDVGRMAVLRSHLTFGHGAFLALLCRLYLEAREAGFDVACGMMAAPARSLVARLGLQLELLGPEREHAGQLRAPVRFVLAANAGPLADRWGAGDQEGGGPSTRLALTPPNPNEFDSP